MRLPPRAKKKPGEALRDSEQRIAQALARGKLSLNHRNICQNSWARAINFSPETVFAYGMALMKSRREHEAIRTFTAMRSRLTEVQRPQWETELVPLLGDLHFAINDYATARNYYREATQLSGQLRKK